MSSNPSALHLLIISRYSVTLLLSGDSINFEYFPLGLRIPASYIVSVSKYHPLKFITSHFCQTSLRFGSKALGYFYLTQPKLHESL